MFIERALDWLRPGGTLGIVMAKGQLDNREAYAARKLILEQGQLLAVVNLHEDTFQPFVGSRASVLFVRKRSGREPSSYPIFMAISNEVGQTSRGAPIYELDESGKPKVLEGVHIVKQDLSDIAKAFAAFQKGELQNSAFRFAMPSSQLDTATLSFNPVRYLPGNEAAWNHVLRLGETDAFEIRTLGTLGRVFNGPRFKRPYADRGVTSGDGILQYFTGTALTQAKGENIKYLDKGKADRQTRRHLDSLIIRRGYILITDSGTLGRVVMALKQHDGHVATNNLIRVVIDDHILRFYVYEVLRSELGQRLMLRNAYGTNQEHLEPDEIKKIPIPIPRNPELIRRVAANAKIAYEAFEESLNAGTKAQESLDEVLGFNSEEE
ncbi:MAG: hypothetical protein DCC64_14180 [Planctomycetota bacterium]|nr:MAG: hypothetical protein DCC64_14180 [Planctomycetota bacterium]